MSISIKLDAPAVRALIDGNNEFRLELQRSVIAEITRNLYVNDVSANVVKLLNAVFDSHKNDLIQAVKEDETVRKLFDERLSSFVQSVRAGSIGYSKQKALSPEVKAMINAHVHDLIRTECTERLGRIPDLVEAKTKEIEEEVMRRIGNLAGVVEHNTKVEMLKQVRADVAKTIMEKLG